MLRLPLLWQTIVGLLPLAYSSSAVSAEIPRSGELSLRLFYPGVVSRDFAIGDSDIAPGTNLSTGGEVDHGRLAIVGGTLLTAFAVIHLYQQNGWWKDNRTAFHFQEDLVYGLNVDKIGHIYGTHVMAYTMSGSLRWANVSQVPALWMGSAGALLFETYLEMEDGFSSWGFDRVDFAADVVGAAWPVLRHYLPALQTLDLKASYHPSDLLGSTGGIGFRGQQHLVLDDYEGQTFWLSVKVHSLLSESLKQYWPEFLGLAVGYGARDIAERNPYRVYFVSLDLDMTKVIPQTSGFLKGLGEVLNFIHLPLPAVQISPGTVWYGVYF